jgi:2-amino-4-hydroxy-6-hydroxymethyldihydropteridine diphosphokinase
MPWFLILAMTSTLACGQGYPAKAVRVIVPFSPGGVADSSTRVVAASAIEETAPLGGKAQPAYLNQMVLLETSLEPHTLLEACHAIEEAQGRVRTEHWGSRTIDIDIVRFGARRLREPDLIIPHPGLADRDFWQREMAELQTHER